MDLDLDAALSVARDAAAEAGDLLMRGYRSLPGGAVRSKAVARDLVTDLDVASERLLVERLRAAFPGHAFEGEEEVIDPLDLEGPRWILDPLDGTINFVHGLPAFAVSVALYLDEEPLVGVIHAPLLSETFSAVKGRGAHGPNGPMRVRDTDRLGDALLATGFPYGRNELEHDNLANFSRFFYDVRGMRRMGSAAVDLAYLADGRFDGFWELHLGPHDVAAGALIVRESGGVVSDASGGDDWLRGGSIVAAGEALHPLLLERVEH
ncbi:MAG: inositol monophosphatase [Planctomycetes bacterium]|nr:inositol monophosphatase [Planctomycetota bacterium]